MKIPLGISVQARPTFGDLYDRAKQRVSLIAAGQELLKYVSDEAFILSAHIEVNEGRFELDATIPINPQIDFLGHEQENSGHGTNPMLRRDDAEQQAIDETVAAIQNSSRIVDRVAEAMASLPSSQLATEIKRLEKKEGVDTKPARSFIYLKQEGFVVDVDDEAIQFRAHVVRTAVANAETCEVVMTRVQPRSESTLVRGLVHETNGDGRYGGVQSGGAHEFRFVGLEGWQKVVLESACWLQLPIRLAAVETVSTCTLAYRPNDVHQVHNWIELLEDTFMTLRKIRDALNERHSERRSEAA